MAYICNKDVELIRNFHNHVLNSDIAYDKVTWNLLKELEELIYRLDEKHINDRERARVYVAGRRVYDKNYARPKKEVK